MKEISAIMFSCNALWSKLAQKEKNLNFLTKEGIIMERTHELIEDGLFVFHNPYAKYPLDKSIFGKDRVCQVYLNDGSEKINDETVIVELESRAELIIEFGDKHMISRLPF